MFQEFVDGKMNGEKYDSGKFATSLRKHLFCEHLGLLTKNKKVVTNAVDDPVIDTFYHNLWEETADRNTKLFEDLFSTLPSDSVSTKKRSKEIQIDKRPMAETLVKEAKQKVTSIKGHLVRYPLEYLCQEDLQPSTLAKEGIVPSELWK